MVDIKGAVLFVNSNYYGLLAQGEGLGERGAHKCISFLSASYIYTGVPHKPSHKAALAASGSYGVRGPMGSGLTY
jgi:hypothetical protein